MFRRLSLCSGLLRDAPYCVPGGVRVVSEVRALPRFAAAARHAEMPPTVLSPSHSRRSRSLPVGAVRLWSIAASCHQLREALTPNVGNDLAVDARESGGS